MDLNKKIEDISHAEYKLLLIIGQPGSGKSKVIRQYSEETGIPILDLDKIFYHTPSEKPVSYTHLGFVLNILVFVMLKKLNNQ